MKSVVRSVFIFLNLILFVSTARGALTEVSEHRRIYSLGATENPTLDDIRALDPQRLAQELIEVWGSGELPRSNSISSEMLEEMSELENASAWLSFVARFESLEAVLSLFKQDLKKALKVLRENSLYRTDQPIKLFTMGGHPENFRYFLNFRIEQGLFADLGIEEAEQLRISRLLFKPENMGLVTAYLDRSLPVGAVSIILDTISFGKTIASLRPMIGSLTESRTAMGIMYQETGIHNFTGWTHFTKALRAGTAFPTYISPDRTVMSNQFVLASEHRFHSGKFDLIDSESGTPISKHHFSDEFRQLILNPRQELKNLRRDYTKILIGQGARASLAEDQANHQAYLLTERIQALLMFKASEIYTSRNPLRTKRLQPEALRSKTCANIHATN